MDILPEDDAPYGQLTGELRIGTTVMQLNLPVSRQVIDALVIAQVEFSMQAAPTPAARVDSLIQNSPTKIEAIKAVRGLTQVGLKEAKDLVEARVAVFGEPQRWRNSTLLR